MRTFRAAGLVLALVLTIPVSGCGSAGPATTAATSPGGSSQPSAGEPSAAASPAASNGASAPASPVVASPEPTPADVPAAFRTDPSKAADLAVTSAGGGVTVATGKATAAVYVPAGSVVAGSAWKVVPLTEAPAGVARPLAPGIYVDTAGAAPTGECLIAFALPGKASADATIVRIADDGASRTVVATTRIDLKGRTVLEASVDGFSAYTTAEEDAAARDKAAREDAARRGKQVDWTIKASGTETQKVEGWTFTYDLDFFASGGSIGQGGLYKGHASLSLTGKYKGPVSIVKSFGTLSGIGRDQAMTFRMLAPELASLIGGDDPEPLPATGSGTMKLTGMGSLNISAIGPTVQGHYTKNNQKSTSNVAFTIVVKGDSVQVEIAKVGIFPGMILRTTR